MSPEEKAIKLALLDKTPEQQEYYRTTMQGFLDDFKSQFEKLEEEHQELWIYALSVSMIKLGEHYED